MLATKEKSHPGFQLPIAALHPGFGFAISNTATGLADPSYNFRGGPRSSAYFRDAETGLDYAKNRYEQPGMGRFLTPDPYMASGGAQDPGSWNRYAYVGGDPIKYNDPKGREQCDPDTEDCGDDSDVCNPSSSNYAPYDVECGTPPGGSVTTCGTNQFLDSNGSCEDDTSSTGDASTDCPTYMANFYNNFASELLSIAGTLDTSFEMIVAFAALESGWGAPYHMNNHNLFSELQPNGRLIHWNNFGNEEKYVKMRLGKLPSAGGVQGIVDPTEFANQIININWSGDPRNAYVQSFNDVYDTVVQYEPACEDAIALGLSHPSIP